MRCRWVVCRRAYMQATWQSVSQHLAHQNPQLYAMGACMSGGCSQHFAHVIVQIPHCLSTQPTSCRLRLLLRPCTQIDIACAACEAYLLRKARTLAAAGDVAALCSCAQLASTFHLVSACEEMIPHLVPLVLQQHCDLGLLRSTLAELGSSTGQIAALRHSGLGDSLLAALVLSVAAADGSAAQVPPVKRTRSGGSRGGSEGAPGPWGANSKGLDVLELLQLVDWGGMRPVELGALLQQASASCPGPVTDAMGRLVGNALVRGSERSGGFGSRLLGLLHGNSEGSAFRDYVKWATRELQVQALCTAGEQELTGRHVISLTSVKLGCHAFALWVNRSTARPFFELFTRPFAQAQLVFKQACIYSSMRTG